MSLEESTSTSVSTSSQSTMDCNVGANIGVSATMSAKIPMVMDAGMTMSGGINFGESWSKGMTNGGKRDGFPLKIRLHHDHRSGPYGGGRQPDEVRDDDDHSL